MWRSTHKSRRFSQSIEKFLTCLITHTYTCFPLQFPFFAYFTLFNLATLLLYYFRTFNYLEITNYHFLKNQRWNFDTSPGIYDFMDHVLSKRQISCKWRHIFNLFCKLLWTLMTNSESFSSRVKVGENSWENLPKSILHGRFVMTQKY